MKIQVKRFSTHQTAKVFALLMAATSLLFFVPFGLISLLTPTPTAPDGTSPSMMPFLFMFLIMPIFQGVFGYIMIRLGLWVYNKLSPRIGGFEFELEELNS